MPSDADPFLGRPSARVMLFGTLHFQDRGLDRYKPRVSFDVFSPERQWQIEEVVSLLTAFQPTKVAIERTPAQQQEIDASYGAYLRGDLSLPGDEVYQLGFRLAVGLGHTTVYCVNAWDRHYEPDIDLEAYAREHGQVHLLSQWWPRFEKLLASGDQLRDQLTLREILLRANEEDRVLKLHGVYLVDPFKLGIGDEYPGADWVTGWYNRNLRIFANLQRITESADERILLIIGAGHLPILRHCVAASPEYDLVEVHTYLDPTAETESPASPSK